VFAVGGVAEALSLRAHINERLDAERNLTDATQIG
jgi:hypothetical protein